MKGFGIGVVVCIAAMSLFAGSASAGYVDSTGKHRGVTEFRADAQACANSWAAQHQRRAVPRPHPASAIMAKPHNHASARYNFIMYRCLPAFGWRLTSS